MAQSPSPGKGSLTAVASVLAAEFQNGCSAKHAGPSPPLSSSSSSSPPDKHLVTKKLMRLLALPLLQHMGISDDSNNNNNDGAAPASAPLDFVDSACGTGVLTQELQRMLPRDVLDESTFLCADTSRVFVDMVAERARDEGWVNVRPEVLDAMDTGLPENSASHVAVGLGLHIIPAPDDVVRDCIRVLRNGGVFGASTFPETGGEFWIPDLRAAFASLPFDAPFSDKVPMQMHTSGKWYEPDWVEAHLQELGLRDVRVVVAPGRCRIDSGQQFVDFFGSMMAVVTKTWWSEQLLAEHPLEQVKDLVRAFLDDKYGGPWHVSWHIICMAGRVDKVT